MGKSSIFRFLLGTFLLAYVVWGIIFLAQELGWFQYGNVISMILLVIGANSPAIITFFVLKQSQSGFNLKKYFRDAFALKQKPVYYGLTVLFIVLTFAIPALMGGIVAEVPPVTGGTESSEILPLWLTVVGIPLFFFLGGSEELGWRYFLQSSLEKRIPFIPATIIVSIIWTLWHLPLFFIIGTSQNATGFMPFAISTIGSAFAVAAIYRIGKSAWLCILFHCATNSLQGTWPISDGLKINIYTSVILITVSIIIILINNKIKNHMARSIHIYCCTHFSSRLLI